MRDAVRVVFVTTVFEATDTGPGVYARYLWSALRDDPRIEFHLVAPRVAESHERLHEAGTGPGSLGTYRKVQELGLRLARELGPRVIVHGNSTHSMARFARYAGPWIVQVNDYDVAEVLHSMPRILGESGPRRLASLAWRHWQERRVLRASTLAVCNSEYTAVRIGAIYELPPPKLVVIHKAVNTAAFVRSGVIASPTASDSAVGGRLVFVGSDWRRKGLDVLLRAAAGLKGRGLDISLKIIGPSSDDPALDRLVAELGLKDRVEILGPLPSQSVARHLWDSDLFVLPSRREAFGVAVLEAMAAGVPVVATRVGGIPEIVTDKRDGLLIGPEDPIALSDAVERLLSDRVQREAIAGAGMRRAQQFTLANMVSRVRAMYISLAAGTS